MSISRVVLVFFILSGCVLIWGVARILEDNGSVEQTVINVGKDMKYIFCEKD